MAHYLIYIPGVSGANNAHLDKLDLGGLATDKKPDWVDCPHGPDGGRGMLCTWTHNHADLDPVLEYNADTQVWKQGPGNQELAIVRGSYWIGHEKARPPRPSDVARTKQYPGRWVELRDCWDWLIPEAMQVPHLIGLDPVTGEVALRAAPEFEAFCEASEEYALLLFQECNLLEKLRRANPKLDKEHVARDFALPQAFEYANQALALNYRVCPAIVDYLGLVTKSEIVRILTATVCFNDILEVIEDQKKTADVVSIPVG